MDDLVTDRLILHPLTVDEARNIAADRPERLPHWVPGYPEEDDARAALRLLKAAENGEFDRHPGAYEIRRRDDGRVVGGLDFHGPADADGAVTVGYGLLPDERGKGYASEALRAALASARARGVRRVKGDADHDNVPSHRVMTAAGMRVVGEDERVKYYETAWEEPA
ncbi:GNAT family N-acetyltransferase [Streptomyces huiliensis]|uniref:GNAT family N-acetyltransferase n=1 Tax=Streptomyces huiliensis TaxID=2876027 RepID=UPI001CBB3F1F|nr:GNAT family protein [Streptomyces huiliensis]MBZ4319602.1 GNAT family N-acetyltransferase [Streptomyces huiliensis]